MKLKIDFKGLKELEKDLMLVRRKAVPHAIRQGLNDTAFAARKVWQSQMQSEFTTRNRYTENSVRVEKARGIDLSGMRAVVGSTADYLPKQEFGGAESSKGQHGVPVPTGIASGEGRSPGSSRKRLVRRPNKMSSIQLNRGKGSGKRRNAFAIAQAKASGSKYVFLELARKKGIFKLSGGKRATKIDMVWDMSKRQVTFKPRPTLAPTLKTVERWAPGIHRRALVEQFRRAGFKAWK